MSHRGFVTRALSAREKYSAVFASTLYSQLLAAANLALVWTLGPASADSYTIGIQVSTFSYAGFVLGIVYLVALGRPNFNSFAGFKVAAGGIAMFAAILGSIPMLGYPTKYGAVDFLTLAFFGVGGALLAIKAVSLVRRACTGEPHLLTRVTILPNLLLAIGLLALFAIPGSSAEFSYAPALFWCAGSVYIFLKQYPNTAMSKKITAEAGEHDSRVRHRHLSQTFVLSIGLVTSNVMPFAYIYALSGLEDGKMAFAFLLLRVVSSGVYLLSHTFLAANLNWQDGLRLHPLLERWGSAVTLAMSSFALGIGSQGASAADALLVLGALGVSLFFSTAYLREVNRLRLQVVLLAKVLADLSISICCALILISNPSAVGLFAVVLTSQCVTMAVCGFGLRKYILSAISVVVVFIAVAIVVK